MAELDQLPVAIRRYISVVDQLVRERKWARWTFSSIVIAAASVSLAGRAQTLREVPAPRQPLPPVVTHAQTDVGPIVSANLFGIDPNGGQLGALVRSALNLVVTGLLASGESSGLVVVSVNGQPETAFSSGDEILPGVRLHAVEAERIIIARGGRLESVPLKEITEAGGTAIVLAGTSESTQPGNGMALAVASASDSPSASSRVARRARRHSSTAISVGGPASAAPAVVPVGVTPVTTGQPGFSPSSGGTTHSIAANDSSPPKPGGGTGEPPPTSSSTVPGPTPGTENVEVPTPKPGSPAPEVPRPAPGTAVPEVPRPTPGAAVDGPPRPAR